MDILPQLFFAYYFGISLAYLGHILGMSWPYHIDMPMIWPKYAQWAHLGHILGISRPSLGNILDLSWECLGHVSEYLGHILGIFLPSLGNVSDISWACLLDRHNICQKIYTARFSGSKFYTAKVRNLRHFSRKLTMEMHQKSIIWAFFGYKWVNY